MNRRPFFRSLLTATLLTLNSCAHVPYSYLRPPDPEPIIFKPQEAQIDRGRPVKFVDFIGHYIFSLPAKLILFSWKVENHKISEHTEQVLARYLEDNQLQAVKVRLNQYSPGAEWRRLFKNRQVGAGWRYTIGFISVLMYTIFPGRVFGGDSYNPYTNTISIYSDIPAIALHEGAHAKDFMEKKYRGSYAALSMLPLVSLWFEGEATGDTLGYLKDNQCRVLEKDSYKILYPAYFTYIGGEAADIAGYFTKVPQFLALAAVIPGHIAGRIRAAFTDTEGDQCRLPRAAEEPRAPAAAP